MITLKTKWEREQRGTIIGSDCNTDSLLTYAMFADDTASVAKSPQALVSMLKDLRKEFAQVGLALNFARCKIQVNQARPYGNTSLKVDDMDIPIVDCTTGFTVLGVYVMSDGSSSQEFRKRCYAAA